MKIFLQSCGKSFIWSILILFFGLFQVWLVLATSYALNESFCFTKIIGKMIWDGTFLFFSVAIVSSLTIDYHLSKKTLHHLLIKLCNFLFVIIPVFIFTICMWLFTVRYGRSTEEVNYEFIIQAEFSIFTLAMIYAFVIKVIKFWFFECDIDKKDNS